MAVVPYTENKNDHVLRYIGLSSDTKPTTVPPGSTFIESDTKTVYMFDGTAWFSM